MSYEDLPGEEWRDIPGAGGLYAASSLGRIRSATRVTRNTYATFVRHGRILKTPANHLGYKACRIHANGKSRTRLVHHLVLEAFIGPRPIGYHGCHADGDPGNCAISNLRWDTPKANSADAIAHGAIPRGERAPGAKLKESDVRQILADCRPQYEIAAEFGVSQSLISRIKTRDVWAHL